MNTPDIIAAHKHSSCHQMEIHKSEVCGCFYCLSIFPPDQIQEWVPERKGEAASALCPRCGIDAVIGSASGYPITPKFLKQMHEHWFKIGKVIDPPWRISIPGQD